MRVWLATCKAEKTCHPPAGAIFGLGGALAVYAARHRKIMPGKSGDNLLRSLGQTLAINVVYGLSSPRIDQWCVTAHLPWPAAPIGLLMPYTRAHLLSAWSCMVLRHRTRA